MFSMNERTDFEKPELHAKCVKTHCKMCWGDPPFSRKGEVKNSHR